MGRFFTLLGVALPFCLCACMGEVDPSQYAAVEGPSRVDKDEAEWRLDSLKDRSDASPRPSIGAEAYIKNVTTGHVTRLTNTRGGENSPMLSPDRRRLVFASKDILLMDLRSGRIEHLTAGMQCDRPRWSADGNEILFLARAKLPATPTNAWPGQMFSSERDLYIMDRRGRALVNLTNTPDIDEYGHDWSNDGTAVVYIAKAPDESKTVRLRSMEGRGDVVVPLDTSYAQRVSAVTFSNVPRTVTVFVSGDLGGFLNVNVDTGEVVPLGGSEWFYLDGFDRCERTGRFAIASRGQRSVDRISFPADFPKPVVVHGFAPVWSHDSAFVTYSRQNYPIGFHKGLEEGRIVAMDDLMAVVKLNGEVESFREDYFHEYYPVVQEVVDPGSGETVLKNLRRGKALELLAPKYSWLIHRWKLEEIPWKLTPDEEMFLVMTK